jgi:hypothetical protein
MAKPRRDDQPFTPRQAPEYIAHSISISTILQEPPTRRFHVLHGWGVIKASKRQNRIVPNILQFLEPSDLARVSSINRRFSLSAQKLAIKFGVALAAYNASITGVQGGINTFHAFMHLKHLPREVSSLCCIP